MNKDNWFYLICGFLLGAVVGGMIAGPKIYEYKVSRGMIANPAAMPSNAAMNAPDAASNPGSMQSMQAVQQQIAGLKDAIAKNPNDAEALTSLAAMYMDASKYDQAASYFERALAVRDDPSAESDLALCYRQMQQPAKALELLRKSVAKHPERWETKFNEAIVLADMKQYAEAREVASKLKTEHPNEPQVEQLVSSLAQQK